MPRIKKKVIRQLPEGFGVTKERKTQAKNIRDRALIKMLSNEAILILENDCHLKMKEVLDEVIQNYYVKKNVPKVHEYHALS